MLVFDTSAFINGQRHHFLPSIVPGAWTLVEEAIDDGRVIVPRAVYVELLVYDDDVAGLIKRHSAAVVEPSKRVQRRAGEFQAQFPKPGTRNKADPFILAEAEARGVTVVTYEGTTFAGIPTKQWDRAMPGICKHFGIPCCTLPQALERLGLRLE